MNPLLGLALAVLLSLVVIVVYLVIGAVLTSRLFPGGIEPEFMTFLPVFGWPIFIPPILVVIGGIKLVRWLKQRRQ